MKRKWGAVLFATVLMCVLTACKMNLGGGLGNSGKETLTLMGKETDMQKSYIKRIFDLYKEEGKYDLNIISVKDADFETAVKDAFLKKDAPDILFHFNSDSLHTAGLEDQFVFLDDEEWVSDLTDASKAYCQNSEGRILGLPFWESSVSGCYYNKTILSSLGLRPASTQEEFDMLCQTLKDMGYVPLCWALETGQWMYQFGMDPIFADDPALLKSLNTGKINYQDIPSVRDMVSWIAGAAEKGWFGNGYHKRDWQGLSRAMAYGECVMINIWDTWFYTDLEEGGEYTKEDFALMPVFMNTADSGTYEGGNLNMMMVNKESSHVEEALEFLSFCARSENYNKAFEGISTVSCFKGQTTNIQSDMVTNAMGSITQHQRVSTAEPKIKGYVQQDVGNAVKDLLTGKTDVDGCIEQMDIYRLQAGF